MRSNHLRGSSGRRVGVLPDSSPRAPWVSFPHSIQVSDKKSTFLIGPVGSPYANQPSRPTISLHLLYFSSLYSRHLLCCIFNSSLEILPLECKFWLFFFFLVFMAKNSAIQCFPIKWFNGQVVGISCAVGWTVNLEKASSWSDREAGMDSLWYTPWPTAC